ncbi:MAG: hypothetical protein IKC32_07140 [Clostridia bacterium]|nr:hypothetical protein [Clostridia bacterium]
MTSVKNPYDTLYENLKDRFTVSCEGYNCTLGDYMLIQAGKKQTNESELPATLDSSAGSVASIVDYVTEHLTVKSAPLRERTIKRFPLRSSFSAILTAAAACALVFSFGIFSLTGSGAFAPITAEGAETEVAEDVEESSANTTYVTK